jgi:micrococcal nuclease
MDNAERKRIGGHMGKGIEVLLRGILIFVLGLGLLLPAISPFTAAAADRVSILHLQIGSQTMDLNGISRTMDVAPFIENSRTWVPVRFVSENLAATVGWNSDNNTVTISQLNQTLALVIGETYLSVNGSLKQMDVAPFIRDDRTWVPVRFVTENMGAEVSWDTDDKIVTITFPGEVGAVTSIVDGDTIFVGLIDGDRLVRLIGINTAEPGSPYSQEATNAMAGLVNGKAVLLQRDVRETDDSGRLLRYIFLGTLFVNAEMVKQGWAKAVQYPPDINRAGELEACQQQAQASALGIWSSQVTQNTPTPTPSETETYSPPPPAAHNYVGNSNTKKFHFPSCSSVPTIHPEHVVYFTTRDEAISAGYVPCKKCNP